MSGAAGSKRPILWSFLYARTVSGRAEYFSSGISYLGTDESGGNVERVFGVREVTLEVQC